LASNIPCSLDTLSTSSQVEELLKSAGGKELKDALTANTKKVLDQGASAGRGCLEMRRDSKNFFGENIVMFAYFCS
jgi:hypothetical protein